MDMCTLTVFPRSAWFRSDPTLALHQGTKDEKHLESNPSRALGKVPTRPLASNNSGRKRKRKRKEEGKKKKKSEREGGLASPTPWLIFQPSLATQRDTPTLHLKTVTHCSTLIQDIGRVLPLWVTTIRLQRLLAMSQCTLASRRSTICQDSSGMDGNQGR
ncbi:hypothetical protein LY78DRAFT_112686 [Colletotrichum sublineola]|nr:hypothetical protein LY78DRAFT_112686 [Colletotrichum sublineola]